MKVTVAEHLGERLHELMSRHSNLVLLGEDVGDGTLVGWSRTCASDPALSRRILGTPLVPTTIVAHAAGLAMGGFRPVVLFPSAAGFFEACAHLLELSSVLGGVTAPVVAVVPFGSGFGPELDEVVPAEGRAAGWAGVRVACVGRADEAGAWLGEVVAHGVGLSVLFVPRELLLAEVEVDACAQRLGRPAGQAHFVRRGAKAVVFTWGAAVDLVVEVVDRLQQDVAVIDLGALAPLDATTVVAAVRATGRAVIVHAGVPGHPIGAAIAALAAEHAILSLDAPVVQVSGRASGDAHGAPAGGLPAVQAIEEGILRTLAF